MMEALPERAFDVGIAEQHAVTLLQEWLHKECTFIAIFTLHFTKSLRSSYTRCFTKFTSIFCLDRAGLVGEDGPTHHGYTI
jgi:1-deoxy-D-xylulose-5-phosphate synthase